MFELINGNAQKLDYSFLLLTHLMCADQQIHNKEWQYLKQVENTLMVSVFTKEEQDKIITQDETMLSVETVAQKIAKTEYDSLIKQLVQFAHIDDFYAPSERKMIETIRKMWGLSQRQVKYLELNQSLQKMTPLAPIKHSKKKINLGDDYTKALKQCAKVANQDFSLTKKYLKETKIILEVLEKTIIRQLDYHKNHNSQFKNETYKDILKQLEATQQSLNTEINKQIDQAIDSLHAKERSLKYFTIAFMGRTKAGKSTLHAVMTGEGWEAIGVGKQRTTRLNRVYELSDIRIIDTPGIGAPGGKSDEEIAQSVIDEADVICYVVTNDSIQETEFEFLKQLKEKSKPLIVLLNLKDNVKDSRRLQRFLKNPDKLFKKEGNDGIAGHISRIRRYAKEHYSNDYFPIIPVMLLAAQISKEIEDKQQAEQLFKASRIDDFFTAIRESIIDYGSIRRSQTLLGSTVGNIEQPNQWIKKELESYQNLTNTLKDQSVNVQKNIKQAQKDSRLLLKQRIDETFETAIQTIPSFAEDYWNADADTLQREWARKMNQIKLDKRVENSYKEAGQQFNEVVKDILDEVEQELILMSNLNGHKFKFSQQDSNDFWRMALKFGGGLLAVGAGLVALFFPPFAVILGGVAFGGGILNALGGFMKSKSEKRKKAVNNISDNLRSQLKEQQEETVEKMCNEFDTNCLKLKQTINTYFKNYFEIFKELYECFILRNKDLFENCDSLNCAYSKRIIDYSRQKYEPLTENNINKIIVKVDRKFGDEIKIQTQHFLNLKVNQSQLEQILQEKISIIDLQGKSLLK
ncbi:unknown [Crocosphaera subtropica ATCC 51142]|uniref:G domain-containing protein n=1 Tax=Crocosphaera subtropica (strain ATCC 51142 / BH68) TaxID=43989 RepID=B1X0I5_CROS5|nr:GTPase [Crocosphaera subtropica]ACB51274.1 unknown [Crocosphaera subtropica ATCC 51142]